MEPLARQVVIGTRREGSLALAPWLRRTLQRNTVDLAGLQTEVLAKLPQLMGGRVAQLFPEGDQLLAVVSYEEVRVQTWRDEHGQALWEAPTRQALPPPCRSCVELPWCTSVNIVETPAYAWRKLGLIEPDGVPTRRGIIFSYFQHGEGLAVAAGLEQGEYALEELVFDLANLRGGARFAGDDAPHSGRLALVCQQAYGRATYEGYLDMGVPAEYGAGASEAVREMVERHTPRGKLLTEAVRAGDLERAVIEWRSLLRQITHAPEYPWPRWTALKGLAEQWSAAAEAFAPRHLAVA